MLNYNQRKLKTLNAAEDAERFKTHIHVGENVTGYIPWETLWHFFFFYTKERILFPYNPEVMLLGIYPKMLKTHVHHKA